MTIASLRLMNIKTEDVSADIELQHDIVTLDSIHAALYGGKLQGVVSGHDFATQPKWQWDMQLDNIQLKPLLQDVNGVDSKIKIAATGSFKMQANSSGNTREQLLRQLNGNSAFALEDGIVEGNGSQLFCAIGRCHATQKTYRSASKLESNYL